MPQIYEACIILIRFILLRLPKVSVHEIKWLLPALKNLCEVKPLTPATANTSVGNDGNNTSSASNTDSGDVSNLCLQFDHNAAVQALKNSKYPESSKSSTSGSSSSTGSVANSDKELPKTEVKRSRSDLSTIIVEQLATPLETGKMIWPPLNDALNECSVCILNNILLLFLIWIYLHC